MDFVSPLKQYKSKTHLTYSCQYHVIFCPKYRRKILKNGIDIRLKELFLEIADTYDFQIIEMEIMPDHVHLLIDCNPRFGIMDCINKLKGITANRLRKEFPEIKSKLPTLWTRSAFISTVGSVSLEVVRSYIEKQKGV
jgi:putative transposase